MIHSGRLSNHRFADRCGARIFAEALQRHGVTHIFGQSIPSSLHLVAPEFGIQQVPYRTENAGAAMADGYARISNRVAVVSCQNGPAATLMVPGLAEAYKASIPIVAIVQDVDRRQTERNAFQELDHVALFDGCCKWVRRLSEASRIADYVDMAFTAAATGRPGPAVLIVPIDLLENSVADEPPPVGAPRVASLGAYPLDRSVPDLARIRQAAELLSQAERPLIIAGGGTHSSQAAPALASLQENAALPVATTSMGKGAVNENHPLSIGVVGYFMGKGGIAQFQRALVEEADVVLLVGNRTNQNGTDSWRLYPPGAKYIHIDVDGQEVGRNYEAAVRLVGDARETLTALSAALEGTDLEKRHRNRAALEARISEGRTRHRLEVGPWITSDASPLRPERVMAELGKRLTPETIVVADASYSSIWVANYLPALHAGTRFITPRGLAGLGWGLPLAMGAHMARPHSPIFCVVGDGGFGHVWSELEAARRSEMALTLIVLNNQILGYQTHAEDLLYGDHTDACRFTKVDHAAIASAAGCKGVRVDNVSALAFELAEAPGQGVTLLDVVTDPTAFPPVTIFDGKY